MKMGLQELLMEVETLMPQEMINAAAPDGAPPRRIKTVEIITCQFSWFGCELPFMSVSTEQIFLIRDGVP